MFKEPLEDETNVLTLECSESIEAVVKLICEFVRHN